MTWHYPHPSPGNRRSQRGSLISPGLALNGRGKALAARTRGHLSSKVPTLVTRPCHEIASFTRMAASSASDSHRTARCPVAGFAIRAAAVNVG